MAAQRPGGVRPTISAARATDAAAAEQIAATAEELSATIQELSGAATEIMAAVDQINRGSQLQAAATQQTSAALAQIEAGARRGPDQRGRRGRAGCRDSMPRSTAAAGRSSGLIAGVHEALADTTRASLATIRRLEGIGRRIDKIVDSIALVAVQTSMLAVSGSVEAARAGERGARLRAWSPATSAASRAKRPKASTAIKDTVRGILDQITTLRRDLRTGDRGRQRPRCRTICAISAAMEKLDGDVAALRSANKAILDGAEAIRTGAAETAAGARQIAAAAEEASSASRQAATAASQQARGAEDLAAAIEEIASLADELKRQQNG